MYFRFPLSCRDIQEMMAERGIAIRHEATRNWCEKFGRDYSRRIRLQRGSLGNTWHLDEVVVRIAGQQQYLWRAVGHEGNVLDVLVQARRDKKSGIEVLVEGTERGAGYAPRLVVTDRLASYREPCAHLVSGALHVRDKGANNRDENLHQPARIRERRMKCFKSIMHA